MNDKMNEKYAVISETSHPKSDHIRGPIRVHHKSLPKQKKLWVALSSTVYGIGKSKAFTALEHAGVDPYLKVHHIEWTELQRLRHILEKVMVLEGKLKREEVKKLNRLKRNGSLRGRRHRKKLPVRGQRTRTNSRTARKSKVG